MFELDYRIVYSEYDDFVGQNGFFQIKCNGYVYGEVYPEEIEKIMDKVSLYDWFERMVKVVKNLMTKDYVALSDVESYNAWIVFEKRNDNVIISLMKGKKEQGSHDIEFILKEIKPGEWVDQTVRFDQLRREIINKGREYIKNIEKLNGGRILIDKMKQSLDEISEK